MIRVWLKIQELGLRRFESLVPYTKGAILVHPFEPQPSHTPALCVQGATTLRSAHIATRLSRLSRLLLRKTAAAKATLRPKVFQRPGSVVLSDGVSTEFHLDEPDGLLIVCFEILPTDRKESPCSEEHAEFARQTTTSTAWPHVVNTWKYLK